MPAKLSARILVVDDHVEMARMLADQLADAGYAVDLASNGSEALSIARARLPDLVITDLRMSGVDGLDVLEAIQQLDHGMPVLIMTAFGAVDSAVEAIKRGAYHYLTKPFQLSEMFVYVERALLDRQVRDENRALRRIAQERSNLRMLVGESASMRALAELVERFATSTEPVVIRGESGTGKELVARALHFLGPRAERSFVAVNCATLPEPLLESELFGHVRGAFTGASGPQRGLFVEADGGTLFLDEIGDMPIELQAKILRAVEDGVVRAVGSDANRKVDIRIVAATHRPLEELIQAGGFRADLFYRLNVIPVSVPPLRERADDIPLLVEHFLARTREASPGIKVLRFSPELVSALASYTWPGNVRELENVVKRLCVVCTSEIATLADLERHAPTINGLSPIAKAKVELLPLRQVEDEYIAWVIQRCDGNKTRAAEILGIDVSTIHRREKSATKQARETSTSMGESGDPPSGSRATLSVPNR